MSPEKKPDPAWQSFRTFLIVIVIIIIYAYGFQVTKIDLEKPKEEQRQTQAFGHLRQAQHRLRPNRQVHVCFGRPPAANAIEVVLFQPLDPFQAALGRPNRDQVVSMRPDMVSTLAFSFLVASPNIG